MRDLFCTRETVAVWIPPLLGAATVVATYFLCRRAFGGPVGVIAAASLCVMPAHVHYSQIGFVDHHAAVAFLTTLLFAALLGSARRDWDLASVAARIYRVILAGGLTPGNIGEAVRHVRPWGVDVSSGVESAPGIKSRDQVRDFIDKARAAAEAGASGAAQ